MMKGKYYCQLYDGRRGRSLCLRTDNYELACQRYAAGLKELRKKIRAEHPLSIRSLDVLLVVLLSR